MSQKHLVPLNADGWSLWKWFELRSGGFPAEGALGLGAPEVDEALDARFFALEKLSEARTLAKARLDELAEDNDVEISRQAKRTRKRLVSNKSLSLTGDSIFDERLGHIKEAEAHLAQTEDDMLRVLEHERIRSSEALREFAQQPRFREAIVWQNRAVLTTAIDGYLRSEVGVSNKRGRERQRMLAKYIQRYTLKNDTIGFFGPTAWGHIEEECDGFKLEPGPVIARREAFFEYWMTGALVEQLNKVPEMFPICSLRLRLGSWVEDKYYYGRDGTTTELSALQSGILSLATSTATLGELAAFAVANGLSSSEELVYDEIRELVRLNFASAKIEVPTEIIHPEKWLRTILDTLPASAVRDETLSTLNTLESNLTQVASAAGNVDLLNEAIEELEKSFVDATSMVAKRAHGQVYAGRQIFYEECVRGGDLKMGGAFVESLSGPLSLVLTSARWFTYHIGRKYRAAFQGLYKELTAQGTDKQISLMNFQVAAVRFFEDDPRKASEIIKRVQVELRRRWEQVLQIDGATSSRVSIESEACASRVAELFAAPGPGWPMARYQSPDIMLAASSAKAVDEGDFQAVLGELHCGINSLLAMAPFYLHPEKQDMALANSEDTLEPSISPLLFSANRVAMVAVAPDAIDIENKGSRSWRPRSQVLITGDLFVEELDGQLDVVSRSTGERFDIMRFMDNLLSNAALSHFSLLPRKPHMPRVTIDNLIISRERWTYKRPEFADLVGGKATPQERFVAVSEWVRERGLPRFMFAVVPNELKPLYVDFASATLVDVLLHFLSKAVSLSLSEMLPGHEEQWLTCEEGKHYASELRIVALDPVAWKPGL